MSRMIAGLCLAAAVTLSGPCFAQATDVPAPVVTPAPAPAADRAANEPAAVGGIPDNQLSNDVDARIAVLKAELRLTPDQERAWGGFQTALHNYGMGVARNLLEGRTVRQDRRRRDDRAPVAQEDDIARMRREADDMSGRAESLRKMADAAEPVYKVLDDRQRRRLIQFVSTGMSDRPRR